MVTLTITGLAQVAGGLMVYGHEADDALARKVVCCVNAVDATDIVNALAANQPVTIEIDRRWLVPVLSLEVAA